MGLRKLKGWTCQQCTWTHPASHSLCHWCDQAVRSAPVAPSASLHKSPKHQPKAKHASYAAVVAQKPATPKGSRRQVDYDQTGWWSYAQANGPVASTEPATTTDSAAATDEQVAQMRYVESLQEKNQALRAKLKALKGLNLPCHQSEIDDLQAEVVQVANLITSEKPPAQRLLILLDAQKNKSATFDKCERRHAELRMLAERAVDDVRESSARGVLLVEDLARLEYSITVCRSQMPPDVLVDSPLVPLLQAMGIVQPSPGSNDVAGLVDLIAQIQSLIEQARGAASDATSQFTPSSAPATPRGASWTSEDVPMQVTVNRGRQESAPAAMGSKARRSRCGAVRGPAKHLRASASSAVSTSPSPIVIVLAEGDSEGEVSSTSFHSRDQDDDDVSFRPESVAPPSLRTESDFAADLARDLGAPVFREAPPPAAVS